VPRTMQLDAHERTHKRMTSIIDMTEEGKERREWRTQYKAGVCDESGLCDQRHGASIQVGHGTLMRLKK